MSTRATYEIEGRTFYIHHDGYPEGAASYIYNMVKALTAVNPKGESFDIFNHRMCRGGLEFAFIRGNGNAEPTESHNAHGDTEYRYTVSTVNGLPILLAEKRCGDWSNPSWQVFFHGPLTEFVNEFIENGLFQNMTNQGQGIVYAILDMTYPDKILCTVEEAKNAIEAFNNYAEKFDKGNPNRQSNFNKARDMQEAVKAFTQGVEAA